MLVNPMTAFRHLHRTLAVDPSSKGFGFAVLENPKQLVDWGLARIRTGGDRQYGVRFTSLLKRCSPSLVVLEDIGAKRVAQSAGRRIDLFTSIASEHGIAVIHLSRQRIAQSFGVDRATKYDVAILIAHIFPELEFRLPSARKPWTSEDERMNIFDAIALGVAASELLSE